MNIVKTQINKNKKIINKPTSQTQWKKVNYTEKMPKSKCFAVWKSQKHNLDSTFTSHIYSLSEEFPT